MADAKAEQQPRRIRLALCLDRGKQVVDRLVLPPIAPDDLLAAGLQAENIGRAFQPAQREELGNGLFAQPLDIERTAADEVLQAFGPLRRADQPAGAAHIDLAFLGHRLAAAFRAVIGERESRARFVAGQVLHHLRNHVARALQHHAVAHPHPQPRDLVAVVERDVGNDHAAHRHRRQAAHGRQLASAAHLDVDGFQRGFGAFGGKLVRHAPARRLGDKTQPLLPVEPVDLVDHAVDVIGQVRPLALDPPVMLQHRGRIGAAHQQRGYRHAPGRNCLHHLQLGRPRNLARRAPAVRPEPQGTAGGDAGVLLPQRSGGGIARVGKDLVPPLRLRGVERGEIGLAHEHFAANFEHGRHVAAQGLRNVGNRGDIGRHVLAHLPVPARRRAHQQAVFIAQGTRQPVDLVLRRHRHGRVVRQGQEPPHPRDEFGHVLVRERVVEAHHPHFVGDFRQRRCSHFVPDQAAR